MIVIAEMQTGGVFEAESKRKLSAQMIQHFAENDEDAGQIKAIYVVKKDDSTDELCSDVVAKIQDIIDEGVAEWREAARIEREGQKDIERDYWASRL